MGSSPGRHKGSDATEQLMLSFSTEEARSLGAPETALGPQDVDGCWLRRPRQRRDIYPVCGLGATEAKRLQAALVPTTHPLGEGGGCVTLLSISGLLGEGVQARKFCGVFWRLLGSESLGVMSVIIRALQILS